MWSDSRQTGAWYSSVLEAIAYFITFVLTVLMVRRASYKKKLAKSRESRALESGYAQPMEMGTVYTPGTEKRYMPIAPDDSRV